MSSIVARWPRGAVRLALAVSLFTLGPIAPAAGPAAAAGPVVTVGSNASDPAAKASLAALMAHCADAAAVSPSIDTYDHAAFQDGITTYLRGDPEDVVTWFGGERMRFLAAQGLLSPVSDVWAGGLASSYSPALKALSTGYDGRQYLVPVTTYPWVVVYRKSLFAARGYTVPATIGDFVALAQRMLADGLTPLASAAAEGWSAMGLFDILDMRMNGYAFHMDLMAGRAAWTDERVAGVFREWSRLLALSQPDGASRTWQQAAGALFAGQAGMDFVGTFVIDAASDLAIRADLGMFPFPTYGNQWDAERAIDAPVDGLALSRAPEDPVAAKALLACAGTGAAQLAYLATGSGMLAAATDADTSGYSTYQRDAAAIVASAGRVANFLDRDARPDFTGAAGMQAFVRDWVANPGQDVAALLRRIQAFRDRLPPVSQASVSVVPSRRAGTIPTGTAVTFVATVRPLGPTPATVRFAVYQRVGTVSRLKLARDVVATAAGRATFRFAFRSAGQFYVVARVVPDHTYLGTPYGAPIRYTVH